MSIQHLTRRHFVSAALSTVALAALLPAAVSAPTINQARAAIGLPPILTFGIKEWLRLPIVSSHLRAGGGWRRYEDRVYGHRMVRGTLDWQSPRVGDFCDVTDEYGGEDCVAVAAAWFQIHDNIEDSVRDAWRASFMGADGSYITHNAIGRILWQGMPS